MISRWTVVNVLLLAIVALLAVETGRTLMRTVPPFRAPVPGDVGRRRTATPKARPARADNVEQDVAVIISLDLFDQSRQAPGTVTEAAAPVEVPPPDGIEVVGIRSIGGDQEAFIRDASQGNAQRRVRTGDEVAGYTVQSINATQVDLGNMTGQMVTLYLQLAPSRGGKPGVPGAGPRRPAAAGPPTTATASSSAGAQAARMPAVDQDAAARRRIEERWNQRRLQQQRKDAPAPGMQRRSGLTSRANHGSG